MDAKKIEKEEIVHLHFLPNDVLKNDEQRRDRGQKLIYAAAIGNTEKHKCKIVFNSQEGDNYVETTIWAVTDKYLCLKGGILLLITSIIEVVL
jgi:hypothetical protein